MNHTPEPWVARKFPTGRSAIAETWILDSIPDDANGKVVANAICKLAGTNAAVEANAKLIVSAPDLLAALRWYVEHDDTPDGSEYYEAGRQRAIAAIEKATSAAV